MALVTDSILFLALKGTPYSRTLNYFHGLQKLGLNADWLEINLSNLGGSIRFLRKRLKEHPGAVVIASPSHIIAPLVFLLTLKRPILDAGWPLLDGVISSRRAFGFLGLNFIKTYLIDLLAFHCSRLVLLESEQQVSYSCRTFFLSRKKAKVLFTGCDEVRFLNSVPGKDDGAKVVLFRGGNQSEAGIDLLMRLITDPEFASHGISFVVISRGISPAAAKRSDVKIISEFTSDEEISSYYRSSWLTLGQLSSHSRLKRTIPHKFFEAAFFSRNYLTSDSPIMKKFADNGEVSIFRGDSEEALKRAIIELVKKDKRLDVGTRLGNRYQKEFSQTVLSHKFLNLVLTKD